MSARVFVDGLPPTVRPQDLVELLAPFGTVERIDLRDNAAAIRYAFVDMAPDRAAGEAERGLNRSRFQGHTISVLKVDGGGMSGQHGSVAAQTEGIGPATDPPRSAR
jgi:RNA recognition motif-containing protein